VPPAPAFEVFPVPERRRRDGALLRVVDLEIVVGTGVVGAAANCAFNVLICFGSFLMIRFEALAEAASTLGIKLTGPGRLKANPRRRKHVRARWVADR